MHCFTSPDVRDNYGFDALNTEYSYTCLLHFVPFILSWHLYLYKPATYWIQENVMITSHRSLLRYTAFVCYSLILCGHDQPFLRQLKLSFQFSELMDLYFSHWSTQCVDVSHTMIYLVPDPALFSGAVACLLDSISISIHDRPCKFESQIRPMIPRLPVFIYHSLINNPSHYLPLLC